MLASLETPLRREDTAAVVAVTVSQLLMQTGRGDLCIPSPLPAAGDWELSAAESPARRLGTRRAVPSLALTLTESRRARLRARPARLPGDAPT